MTKRSGVDCGGVIPCTNPNPTAMCEFDEGGNCNHWLVGDIAIVEQFDALSADEFHFAMEASKTRFFGKLNDEGNLVLEQVGMLARAGLLGGDVLKGLYPLDEKRLEMSNPEHRKRILEWDFEQPLLNVIFQRGNLSVSGTMRNPAAKG